MKRPHRWAALLAALLMAATLAVTPREVRAGGGPYRPIDSSDPPVNMFGEPDVPTGSPRVVTVEPSWRETLVVVGRLVLLRLAPAVEFRLHSISVAARKGMGATR